MNVHNSICLVYAKFNGLSCMVPGYRFCGGLWLYSVSCASLTKNSCNTKVVFNHFDRDSYLYLFYYRYILYISIYHSISFHHIFSRLISSFWPCLVGPPWPLPDVPGWRLGVSVFLLVTSCIASYIYYHLLRNIENILELLITNYSILLVCEENMWELLSFMLKFRTNFPCHRSD